MNRKRLGNIAADAFFDNFSFAGLFTRLRIPGAPREIVDPRSLAEYSRDEIGSAMPGNSGETLKTVFSSKPGSSLRSLENLHQSR